MSSENDLLICVCQKKEQQLDKVKHLVSKQGVSVLCTDHLGKTPLHWAAYMGHLEIVKFLVSKGADANSVDDSNNTSLHSAVSGGCLAIVQFLAVTGATIDCMNNKGETPLRLAVHESLEIVKFLISQSAVADCTGNTVDTALFDACVEGRLDVVEFLESVRALIDPPAKFFWGTTPLCVVAKYGHLSIVKFLLSKGVSIQSSTILGDTPLHCACERSQFEIVKHLVSQRARISIINKSDTTPLHIACKAGSFEIVEFLITQEKHTNNRLNECLPLACYQGDLKIVKLLVSEGADVNWTYPDANDTPLHAACDGGHSDIVSFLIEKGAKVNCICSKNKTPLTYAASLGLDAGILILLSKGANPNVRRIQGDRELILDTYLAQNKSKNNETIFSFIRHGAETKEPAKLPTIFQDIYELYRNNKQKLYAALRIYRIAKLLHPCRADCKRARDSGDSKRTLFLLTLRAFSLFGKILDVCIFDKITTLLHHQFAVERGDEIWKTQKRFYDKIHTFP